MQTTSLDPFRALLDHFDDSDRHHQLAFFRILHHAGPPAVQDLAPRILRPTAPRGLRLLAVEASYYYPWPDWAPILTRLLRHESDFGIFSTGTEALGRIRTAKSLEALRELLRARAAPQFQSQIAEVLERTDPAEAFRFHMGRLLEGSQNPSAANEAAHRLTELVDGESLVPLQTALRHPDLLIFRHALRLIATIPTPESAAFLAGFLEEAHREALEDRAFKAALGAFRGLAIPALREAVEAHLEAHLEGVEEEAPSGTYHQFLLEMQALALEGKAARISARLTEAADEIHLRARRLGFAVDTAAEGLAALALQGCLPAEEVLPLLDQPLREQTGGEGVARALARLVPAEDEARLDLLLTQTDTAFRAAGIEILGERKEEALRPTLLRACRDAIYDNAQRALFHLGHLDGSATLARNLLSSSQPEDRDLALRFIVLHELTELVPALVAEFQNAEREDWQIEVLGALGAMKAVQAAPEVADQLHSGQSPRLQTALAETLRDMADSAAALCLCDRAMELKTPHLHALAVEALARAHGTAATALAEGDFPRLHSQIREAWDDRNPWPLRLRVVSALEGLNLAAPSQWATLAVLVQDALAEKRPPSAWTPSDLARVQNAGREWVRRAGI